MPTMERVLVFRPDAATSSSMLNHTTKHSSTSSDDYDCDDDIGIGQSNQQNKQQHAQLSSVDEAHTVAANNSDNKQPKSPFTSVCIDCVETDRKRKSDLLQLHDVSINKKASKICSNEVSIKPGAKSKTKYRYYRHRVKLCSHEGCTNNAQTGGVCIKHGAKKKRYECSYDGCTNQVQIGGVCKRHGAKRKKYTYTCSHEGCTNHVVKGGVCRRHGAQAKLCKHEGCTNQAIIGGVCWSHGAKVMKFCTF